MANIIKAKAYQLLRRDTLKNWQEKNPLLKSGEICLVTDAKDSSKLIKICTKDNTLWSELEYFSPSGNINTPEIDVSNKVNKVIQNSNSGTSISITVPQLKKNKTIGFIGTFESSVSPNLLNLETIEDGKYINSNGAVYNNSTYVTTDFIPAKAGDVIRHQFNYNSKRYDNTEVPTYTNMRRVACYDVNKVFIEGSYTESTTVYTCPEGTSYVRVTFNKPHLETEPFTNNAIIISDSADVIPFYPYGASTPFESLYIYQGKGTGFTECYCVIDDTNLKVYRNGSTTASFEVAHGLTITNYISIVISTTNNNKTIFYLSSNGESFTSAETVWNSSRNQITVEHSLSSCANVLTFGSKDFGERVWLYGDSYFDHWLPNLINRGYTAFLSDGFSGASSSYGATSLENALKMGTPSKVIWCLGMNDADTDSNINGSWLKNITTVKNICDLKGIELIVCTIPNVPERNHTYKNTYIRNNFNYIDVAKLVGSDESTSWYSGLLSTDNVHPSTAGDFYIANIMQSYLPDLRNS